MGEHIDVTYFLL